MLTRQELAQALEDERLTLHDDHPVWGACLVQIVNASCEWTRALLPEGRASAKLVKRRPAPSAMVATDAEVLMAIARSPGGHASDVAGALASATPPVSAALRRLERTGKVRVEGTHRAKRYYPELPPPPRESSSLDARAADAVFARLDAGRHLSAVDVAAPLGWDPSVVEDTLVDLLRVGRITSRRLLDGTVVYRPAEAPDQGELAALHAPGPEEVTP